MTELLHMDRRQFVITTAAACGGLAIGLRFPIFDDGEAIGQARGVELVNWIVIAPDNTVTLRLAQVEMGQGAMTSQLQFIAEELEVDWSKIKVEYVTAQDNLKRNNVYGRLNTGASLGTRLKQQQLREAGAMARIMLLKAAAAKLNAPEAELVAENSTVTHKPSGRKLTYGELAADAAMIKPPEVSALKLKEPKDWKVIGKPIKRLDVAMKVNGTAIFGIDVQVPGMKYAAIMTSPVFGGKLKSYDASAALSRPGVLKVVEVKGGAERFVAQMDDGIAVVADTWWQAKSALDAMPKEWDSGAFATANSDSYFKALAKSTDKPKVLRNEGDVDAALKSAAKVVEAEYFHPYIENANMEPMNATALVTDDKFVVWVPTQGPETALDVASKVSGLPKEKGEVNVMMLGTGFGRRTREDYTSQAVAIAKAMKGTPIKLVWTREETTRKSYYQGASIAKMRAGLDAQGNVTAWDHALLSPDGGEGNGAGALSVLYGIPNVRLSLLGAPWAVPLGAVRGVAYSPNSFFVQSFVDELAVAAGKDSYQFQRALFDPAKTPPGVEEPSYEKRRNLAPGMSNAGFKQYRTPADRALRMRNALDDVAKRADWGKPLGPNRGRGIAIEEETESVTAEVVEVTLDGAGWFAVDRVVAVADSGFVANSNIAESQIEGSIVFGLTAALYGEITVQNGRVVQGNFDDYQMLRISEMPKVEVHLAPDGKGWGGLGEIAVGPVKAALANAIYDAGGPRLRSQPLKNENIVKRS